ncbi:MAG: TonB-dependent receptor [Pseudomonadota bacterium]
MKFSSVSTGPRPALGVRLSFSVLAPMLAGAWAAPACAQTGGAPVSTLSPVVVTASRSPMRVDQALTDITVIERADIERAGVQSLPQLLARQAGLQVSSNGGLGKSSSVFLRGLESRHTLLLIDGVRSGSATVGTPTWENLPLPLIERIEIVRGPLSGLYGSDAVGGVIQIFTRKSEPGVHPRAELTLGSNRYSQVAGGVSFGQGALDGGVQVQHTETRGISSTNPKVPFGNYNPDRDSFRQDAGSARLGLKLGNDWRVDASLLQSDGLTAFDDGAREDSRAQLHSQVGGLALQGKVLPSWATVLRVSRSVDDYDTVRSTTAANVGTIGTVQRQISWENTVPSAVGDIVWLAESIQQNVTRPGAAFAASERTIHGVALGLNGQQGPHTWQANVRRDENSQFGSQTNGALGYGHDLTPQWRLAGSVATSFVAPSFNQLYFPGFGNPSLLPEEGNHKEVSLRWAARAQEVKLSYFDNRIRGYISTGPAPVNIPRTRIDGVSLVHTLKAQALTMETSLEHVDPRNVTPGANNGKQLPRRAQDTLKIAADLRQGRWQWGGAFSAYNRRFDDAANRLRVGGFATLDLHADWQVAREWSLGFRLNNLTDKRYETVYGYNQMGREALVSLRYSGL